MNILESLVLGIVEGLTEFLPVSSTFHLIVTSKILNIESSEFVKLFEVVIQSGAISALLFLYTKTLLQDYKLFKHVIISFIPTAVVGLIFHRIIKSVFFESNWLILSAFTIVGILFILLEKSYFKQGVQLKKSCTDLTSWQAMGIGLAQAISVIPGVSRAGSVIVAMMLMGYKRAEAAKYTFLLSLPTIFAASALDLYQGRELLARVDSGWTLIFAGFLAALFSAYFVVKWLIAYLSNHTLEIFGWYRLCLAAILLVTKALS